MGKRCDLYQGHRALDLEPEALIFSFQLHHLAISNLPLAGLGVAGQTDAPCIKQMGEMLLQNLLAPSSNHLP